MGLPHIKNSKAGINREEPIYSTLFEVYFSIPKGIESVVGSEDINVLTEQVISVGGLDTLDKSLGTVSQTYQGATRTYLSGAMDATNHTITVDLNLNMRDGTDNYVYKLFKAWNQLGYNMNTGERSLKVDYFADFLRVVMYNKAGDIFKDVTFHDVILTGMTGASDSWSYESPDEIKRITVTFNSDWADDVDA